VLTGTAATLRIFLRLFSVAREPNTGLGRRQQAFVPIGSEAVLIPAVLAGIVTRGPDVNVSGLNPGLELTARLQKTKSAALANKASRRKIESPGLGRIAVEPALDGSDAPTRHGPCPALTQPAPKRTGPQSAVTGRERFEVEFGTRRRAPRRIGQQSRGLLFEEVLVVPPARRHVEEMFEGASSERCLDRRQNRRSKAASRVARRKVGRVLRPRDVPGFEQAAQFCALEAEQGANQGRAHFAHSGQAAEAGSAQKAEQDRLDLVVAGMAQKDEAAARTRGEFLQSGVALPPQRVLVAPGRVNRGVVELGAANLRGGANHRGLAGGFGPQTVVDAGHVQGQPEPGRQQAGDLEQGHRVAAARDAEQHRLVRDAGLPQHAFGASEQAVHEERQSLGRHRGPIMPPRGTKSKRAGRTDAPAGWKGSAAFDTIGLSMNATTKNPRLLATAALSFLLLVPATASQAIDSGAPTPAPGQELPAHAAGGWPTDTTGDSAKPPRTAEQQAAIDAVANELKRLANEFGPDSVVLQAKFLIRAMGAGAMGPTEVRVAGPSPGLAPAHLEIDIETGLYFDGKTTTAEARRDTVWKDVAVPVLDEMVSFKIEPTHLELVFLFDVQEVAPGFSLDPTEPARHEAFRVRLSRDVLEDLIADRLVGDAVREKVAFTEPATVPHAAASRTP